MPITLPANRLIAGLPPKDQKRFRGDCELVELAFAQVLARPGERLSAVYFPVNSVISLMTPMGERASLEVGLVGSEGMLGTPLMLGVDVSPWHAVVQGAGVALRLTTAQFRRQLAGSPALLQELKRYLFVLMDQLGQVALCTRFHLVEARLARWLLMTQDRAHADEFHVTHELLAGALGVRRVGITKAAGSLQRNGLISYSRGNVIILDRRGLETASCPCYAVDKATYDRVMGATEPCGR